MTYCGGQGKLDAPLELQRIMGQNVLGSDVLLSLSVWVRWCFVRGCGKSAERRLNKK